MFWYILAVISLIALVAGIIVANVSYDYDWIGISASVAGGFLLILCIILIPSCYVGDRQSINAFVKQKEYIENHVVDNDIENATLTNKKIDLNQWLINAQYYKEHYPLFTFLPDEIMELTPIN